MVSVAGVIGLLVLVIGHSIIAALLTRVFRVRLATRWGPFVYIFTVIPVVLMVSIMLVSGLLSVDLVLGDPGQVLFLLIIVPLAIGIAIDYLWMPAPSEVTLPDSSDSR